MSRRQRTARDRAHRAQVARAKELRRRARARRAATAATAAVTLAGTGAAALTAPSAAAAGADQRATALLSCEGATTPGSSPDNLTDVDGTMFFTASDGAGSALWRTDGTANGTVRLKRLGSDGEGDYDHDYGRSSLVAAGGALFFTADGEDGDELWRSDGTRSGTVLVKHFSTDEESYYNGISNLTAAGDTLFFTADDGTHGEELWKSDGTKAGTVLVKDILPADNEDEYSEYYGGPSDLAAVGDSLFFSADNGEDGKELWTSDGTRVGTVMVKDVHPGAYDSEPTELTAAGDHLFFRARDGQHGQELWRSDGTPGGTAMVKNILPGTKSGRPTGFAAMGDSVFFTANDDDGSEGRDLWTSDGTDAGTVLVEDFNGGDDEYYGVDGLEVVGDRLFFAAPDESHGLELWSSDGSEAGTVLVKDIRPGEYAGYPSGLTEVAGTLFFTARDGAHGRELWRSDGTDAGTTMVEDIGPGTKERSPNELTESGDVLYFAADDRAHGEELWRSDGTADGTEMVADINRGGELYVSSRARADRETGAVRVRVYVDSAGLVTADPVDSTLFKHVEREVTGPGGDELYLTLEPTRKAKRQLRRTGEVEVRAKFTFTSCGGGKSSVTKRYTLSMR
ncbi:ELWxxDGT repeat protein [Nocardioides thalensis]|uniref:ELWxxDGT repeat protein n=1 Tax=Nocardioides thalensis TaxID=1914755 RepID=A0A853C7W8_9ACTN|nr:ELWxxDGT repeat protein [Nocardioides thalensis]NYJ02568.1 ELWxxDGT repeat protein [Nocardioides thalensis]